MSTESDVQRASEKFYEALNRMANGESGSMKDAWSHGAAVTTMHPIGGREVGWEAVEASFAQVAGLASGGRIALEDRRLQVDGDMAYELGVESGRFTLAGHDVAIDQRATNIYRRDAGAWKLVHHHSDLSPAMMDVLKKIQSEA
jgi:ketosteroid isomerase-like protein